MAKLPLLLSALALCLSGLALFFSIAPVQESAPRVAHLENDWSGSEFQGQLADLYGELKRLSARLDALESMPRPSAAERIPASGVVAQAALDKLESDLRAEFAGADRKLRSEPSRLQEDVAIALDEVRRVERETAQEAKWAAAALDKRMVVYQEKLGLSASQTDGLRTVLEARTARYQEIQRLWQEGDREAVGTMKREESQVFTIELEGVLNSQQVEQFREMGGGK